MGRTIGVKRGGPTFVWFWPNFCLILGVAQVVIEPVPESGRAAKLRWFVLDERPAGAGNVAPTART
jgi:hypothetical protein